jgi:hypothetical protein
MALRSSENRRDLRDRETPTSKERKIVDATLLDLVAAEPDLTLMEIRVRLAREKKLKVGITSIWRFFSRNDITVKKNAERCRAGSS